MDPAKSTQKIAKTEYSFSDVKKNLLYKFLYRGDSECMQILLNIYNLEERIENIDPSYMSLKTLRQDVSEFLKFKEGNEFIASNLSQLIHDDINRFSLFVYLEGYRQGVRAYSAANELEVLALKYYSVSDLYTMNILFQYEYKNPEIKELKSNILKQKVHQKFISSFLREHLVWYHRRVLKKKIYELNAHVDRQIMINYESEGGHKKFRESNNHLSAAELHGLNKKLMHFLYRECYRVYQMAYWNGINDLVLKRYH